MCNNETIEKMSNSIIIKDRIWNNNHTTNCYAFGLNLDLSYDEIYYDAIIYNVGFISGKSKDYYTIRELKDALFSDMKLLNIDIEEIDPTQNIKNSEWKLAMYKTPCFVDDDGDLITDFHFVRQNPGGLWLHKDGFSCNISNNDYHKNPIINPKDAYFYRDDINDKEIKFNYLGCYKLKK